MHSGTPLPQGWEEKYDARVQRKYYIDHATKKTQWKDPRFDHPSIWNPQRLGALQEIQARFPNAPETTIREAFLNYGFNSNTVIQSLRGYGFHETQVSPVPAAVSRNQNQADPFALMQVKSRFPSVSDAVIAEILNNGGNVVACCEALKAMGYEDIMAMEEERAGHAAAEAERERERAAAQEKESRRQSQVRNKMSSRFPAVPEPILEAILTSSDYDEDVVVTFLLEEETKERIKNEFPDVSSHEREEILKSVDFEYEEAKIMLQQKRSEAEFIQKFKFEFPTVGEEEFQEILKEADYDHGAAKKVLVKMTRRPSTPSAGTSRNTERSGNPSPKKLVPKSLGAALASDSGNQSRSVPDMERELKGSTFNVRKGPRPAASTNLGSSTSPPERRTTHSTIAKGADPSLRKGPDPELSSGKGRSLAVGPDPSLCKGPDPSFSARTAKTPMISTV